MGHNPTKNPFRRARLGLDVPVVVDEYKARSVWAAWWQLDEKVRRCYFTYAERQLVLRHGKRIDALATFRELPETESEKHFMQVCTETGVEPGSPVERMSLLAQLVCCYESVVQNAARADLAEHDAYALAQDRRLNAKFDHMEREPLPPNRTTNILHMTLAFSGPRDRWAEAAVACDGCRTTRRASLASHVERPCRSALN